MYWLIVPFVHLVICQTNIISVYINPGECQHKSYCKHPLVQNYTKMLSIRLSLKLCGCVCTQWLFPTRTTRSVWPSLTSPLRKKYVLKICLRLSKDLLSIYKEIQPLISFNAILRFSRMNTIAILKKNGQIPLTKNYKILMYIAICKVARTSGLIKKIHNENVSHGACGEGSLFLSEGTRKQPVHPWE